MSDLSRWLKKSTSVTVDATESAAVGFLFGLGAMTIAAILGIPAPIIAGAVVGTLVAVGSYGRKRENLHKKQPWDN